MRYPAVLVATVVLAACNTAHVTRLDLPVVSAGQRQDSLDSVVQFLLTAAATDFNVHHPPDPVKFRNVRIGHSITSGGEVRYLLCGQFLPAQEGGNAEWTLFATIKTSDYEQWIGAQSAAFCQDSLVIWDKVSGLSSALQGRLESLR